MFPAEALERVCQESGYASGVLLGANDAGGTTYQFNQWFRCCVAWPCCAGDAGFVPRGNHRALTAFPAYATEILIKRPVDTLILAPREF
jgi:hypothetical protein